MEKQERVVNVVTMSSIFLFFFTYIPCILIIIKVFSPTDAQLDSLKTILH